MTSEVLSRIARDASPLSGVCRVVGPQTLLWDTTDILTHFAIIRAIGDTPIVMQTKKGNANPVDVASAIDEIRAALIVDPSSQTRRWSPLNRFGFDEVMLIPPSLFKTMLDKPTTWMKDVAWKAVPTYKCEHPREESVAEADAHMRLIRLDWKRPPEPFTRMRFAREKTRIHSTGGKRKAIFGWAEVQRIFGTLATEDGFMELENYEGEGARIEHRGGYSVSFRGVEKELAPDAAKTWLETFAIRGGEDAAKALA